MTTIRENLVRHWSPSPNHGISCLSPQQNETAATLPIWRRQLAGQTNGGWTHFAFHRTCEAKANKLKSAAMARRQRTTTPRAVHQLGLSLRGEGFEGPLEAKGVFSVPYLTRHLRNASEFAGVQDVAEAFREIGEIWQARLTALGLRNEAFTCSTFLEPILDRLGWLRLPQESMPNDFTTRKRPDYCLLTTDANYTAASEADASALFRLSATVLEAKKYNHPLDQRSNTETPGWFPSQQIQDYLNHAKDTAGRRFFDWAILTNGAEWRLYTDRSTVGAYFAFHLVREGQFCTLEEFRAFFTLFRAAAFERTADGSCFLDSVREESLRLQTELESNLRKRIFNVLEDVGTAFVDYEENHLTDADFAEVYDNALIFLYRLLFVLYAESRGLLPVRSHGPGANRRYLTEFSLARLVERLRDRTNYNDDAFPALSEELLRLFQLINGTHARQNEALGVTRYNGGLFSPDLHPKLEQWRIGDHALANVLRQLVFAQPPARAGQPQAELRIDDAIDYSTLEVRQLGDIYEGLLGAHFERVAGRLELRNLNGKNHREGIFYTPDWIVQFLIRETLTPLLDQIHESAEVQRALAARSEEARRNNSFATALLRLSVVDPAMGSGHFLVRATEWLAGRIMQHPTTRPMTEQIVSTGQHRVSRETILARGRIPVSPGVPQERAEISYWRRRVVEACIYGVDINPMAVELAKLSLWLTCIAVDEPLSFLDHHLRHGNALLSVSPDELRRAPVFTTTDNQQTFEAGDNLHTVLSTVIREALVIEGEASTEMEVVKRKERQWRHARQQLQPFLDVANLWLGGIAGLPMDELNYLQAARLLITPNELNYEAKVAAKRFLDFIKDALEAKKQSLVPFHWHLEFPDVFYGEDGQPLPAAGFDALLGNPPYIGTHTSILEGWRDVLERRAGYLEDLYVHFTDWGFQLLRTGGGFGFIVSDTFFTLATKLRMRQLLQSQTLDWLGQCDPFDATVDASVFVARKQAPTAEARLLFVQARPLRRTDGTKTAPEKKLELLPRPSAMVWNEPATLVGGLPVQHLVANELRVHNAPLSLYLNAHKEAFFEPRPGTLALYERFNERVKELVEEWWERIEDSRAFAGNLPAIRDYHQTLQPGDVTLVGLIAEGGQGMRTANNARFLAYLEGTPQARELADKAVEWSAAWLADQRIGPIFRQQLAAAGGDPARPTANRAAWEAAVHQLREQFTPQQLGFGRTDLFRIASQNLIATEADYRFAFDQRKAELLRYWQHRQELDAFWHDTMGINQQNCSHGVFQHATEISDEDFCRLCQNIQIWVARENATRRAELRIPRQAIGLRSSEDFDDPADGPRTATIFNGLSGHGQFIAFRKGDPEGSRWIDNEPLYTEWTEWVADWMFNNSGRREPNMPVVRNAGLYLTAGVTWSLHANHVSAKCRYQEPCIFDASSSRLTPIISSLSAQAFVALANSDVFSFFLKKFIKHNQDIEINDMRMMPVVIPTRPQHARLQELAELCIYAKRAEFSNTAPPNPLVARTREIADELRDHAPAYLCPSAQQVLLEIPRDCLAVLENAVNWEAEKLYGVEGLGPFDEF